MDESAIGLVRNIFFTCSLNVDLLSIAYYQNDKHLIYYNISVKYF